MIYVNDEIGPKGDNAVFAAAGAGPALKTGLGANAAEVLRHERIQLMPEQHVGR